MSTDLIPTLRDGYAQMMFYMREQYWHHGEELCALMVQAYDNHVFRIWRAFALAQQGFENEAIRELKQLLSNCSHNLAIKCPALMATYLIYKSMRDMESAQQVENELNVFFDDRSEMKSNVDGWVEASALCFIASEVNKARDILANFTDNTLLQQHHNEYTSLATLRGWIDLCSGRTALLEKCGSLFQSVLSRKDTSQAQLTSYSNTTSNATTNNANKTSKDDFTAFLPNSLLNSIDVDAALGRIAYFEKKMQFTSALELMNKLIVSAPNATFLLGCKARLLMGAEDWPQCVETVRRILSKESDNIFALSLIIVHALVKENRSATACHYLPLLIDAIDKREPRNAALCCRFAQAYSRLSGTARYITFRSSVNKSGSRTTLTNTTNTNSNTNYNYNLGGNESNNTTLEMEGMGLGLSNQELLVYTMKLAEMAVKLNARNGEYLCELGRQMLYDGQDMKLALATFQRAATLTDGLEPLLGASAAWINMGKWNEASKQIDFCNELQQPNQRNAELSFLNALIAWRYKHDETKCLSFLDQASDAMKSVMQGNVAPSVLTNVSNAGLDCYVRLNMPLMLAIATEYMQHCRNEPIDLISSSSSSAGASANTNSASQMSFKQQDMTVEKCRAHLLLLLRNVPACSAALLLLAQIHFIAGELHDAEVLLKERLLFVGGSMSPSSSPSLSSGGSGSGVMDGSSEYEQQHERSVQAAAFLLSAQICQYTNNIPLAHAALQQALTVDFTIKEQPYYNLLNGMIQSVRNKPQEALMSFKKAKELFEGEVSEDGNNNNNKENEKGGGTIIDSYGNDKSNKATRASSFSGVEIHPLSVSDHVTLYLQTAQAELKLHNMEAARQTLQSAQTKFKNTLQEGRVTIAQAMLAARQDLDQAIKLLRQVPVKSPFYVNARSQLAKLYLVELHHPQKYIACYEEVVEELPSVQALVALGEAYGVVAQYDKAILAYEKARALAPHSSELAICIGRLLVSTHDYTNAIRYYTDAIAHEEDGVTNGNGGSSNGLFSVRADLAILYWHLNDMDNAITTLQEAHVFVPLDVALASPFTFDKEVEFGFRKDESMDTAVERVNCYLLLYKIQKERALQALNSSSSLSVSSNVLLQQRQIAEQCLLAAKKYQMHVLDQPIRNESRETVSQQKRIFANILSELARFYMTVAVQQEHYSSHKNVIKELENAMNDDDGDDKNASNTIQDMKPTEMSKANKKKNEKENVQVSVNDMSQEELLMSAETCLTQSIKFDETNEETLLECVKLHMIRNHIELAEESVRQLLKINSDNEYGLLLQAHLLRERHMDEEAAAIYKRVLLQLEKANALNSTNNNNNTCVHDHYYVILIKYITLLIKSGKLNAAKDMVDRVEEQVMKHYARSHRMPPGLSYAHGVCSLMANESSEALRFFNAARFPCDNTFSTMAMVQMVQLYLVPSATEELWTDRRVLEEQTDNLRAAETLVHQLPSFPSSAELHSNSNNNKNTMASLAALQLLSTSANAYSSNEAGVTQESTTDNTEGNTTTTTNVKGANASNLVKQRLCAECLLARKRPAEVQNAMKLLISLLEPSFAHKYELNLKDMDAYSRFAQSHNMNNAKEMKTGHSKQTRLSKLRGDHDRQARRRRRNRKHRNSGDYDNDDDDENEYDEDEYDDDELYDEEQEYEDDEEDEEDDIDEDEYDEDDELLLKSANYRRHGGKRHSGSSATDLDGTHKHTNASSFTIHTNTSVIVSPEDVLSVLPYVARNVAAALDLAIACYLINEEQLARKVLDAILNYASPELNKTDTNTNTNKENGLQQNIRVVQMMRMIHSHVNHGDKDALLSEEASEEVIERAKLFQSFLEMHPHSGQNTNKMPQELASAEQCLQSMISANKSNGVALDALGTIYEQQQKHKDAAHCYEEA